MRDAVTGAGGVYIPHGANSLVLDLDRSRRAHLLHRTPEERAELPPHRTPRSIVGACQQDVGRAGARIVRQTLLVSKR